MAEKKRKWLVSVGGYDPCYGPPHVFVSEVIELPEGKTPVDWFFSKPKMYYRFRFVPVDVLFGFWSLNNEGTLYKG